ncbi:LuxR C-terminal-related transcriptional regulator [Rhodopseudomonas palustris]|uniref:Transcriptional regulator, LuxR family n=1 Tax=Rhodopseudomonas palustris (strain BisB18) TaxID=316056 RepID=Q20Z23_RHOPB
MPLKRQELPGGAARPAPAAIQSNAAIAEQLVGPLTALLQFMQDLKTLTGADPGIAPADTLVDDALRETQRVCAIVEGLGVRPVPPADATLVPGQDQGASAWWARCIDAAGETPTATGRSIRHRLTPREREVLKLISGGSTNKEGALQLSISPRTYESHRAQIMRKLGARNAADLLRKVLAEVR